MFKSAILSKILITGSKENLRSTIKIVHDNGAMHIKDFTEEKGGMRIGESLPESTELSKTLMRVKSIGNSLNIDEYKPEGKKPLPEIDDWLGKNLDQLETTVGILSKKKATLESHLEENKRNQHLLDGLAGLPDNMRLDVKSLGISAGYLKKTPSDVLGNIHKECKIYSTQDQKKWLVVVHSPLEYEKRVRELLELADIEVIELPSISGTIGDGRISTAAEIKDIEKQLSESQTSLDKLRTNNGMMLLAADEYLSILLDEAETPLHIATTDEFFIMEGWIPSSRLGELKVSITKVFGETVDVNVIDDDDEEAPVLLNNPRAAKPYELLVDAFATPRNGEIDPTTLVAIFFPIFFGMMLGDIGYGLVILAMVFSGITKKLFGIFEWHTVTPQLNKILIYSSISSILFGILYGEFFGFLMYTSHTGVGFMTTLFGMPEIHYHEFTLGTILFGMKFTYPIDRFAKEGIQLLIVFTAMIGIAHLYLAWFIGVRNMALLHGWKEALMEKVSWILLLTGGWIFCIWVLPLIMKGQEMNFFGPIPLIGIAMLVIGLLMAMKAEGFTALVEVPTMLLSNTLSYTRLFAVGASSAGIALAFNNIAIQQIDPGLGEVTAMSWVMCAVILFIGHFMNILLGLLGPTLHSLRLHYVEFFIKFYEGGGIRYQPFNKRRIYTIE